MKIFRIILSLLTLTLLTSCNLEPKYHTPLSPIDLEKDKNLQRISKVFWKRYFKSKDLRQVIQMALDNNHDMRIAYLNIKAAQENYNITSADLLPNISASGSMTRQGVPGAFSLFSPQTRYQSMISLSAYEIDFAGKVKNLRKAALEDFFATQEALEVTKLALIAETANSYAQFLLDKELLEISRKILAAQKQKYDLLKLRYQQGIIAKNDLLEISNLVENAKINQKTYEFLLEKDKNSLLLLTASNKQRFFPFSGRLDDLKIDESSLSLMPSKSLLFRPDIRQAEHNLRAANANIGAARAAFFPSITLTANAGYSSTKFSNLFSSKTWNYTPQINIPIFAGGANKANLKIAKLEKYIEITQYQKAIRTAFREVKDGLEERKSTLEQLKSATDILKNRKEIYQISTQEEEAGTIDLITLADSEIALLNAQRQEAEVRKSYVTNLINLYKVLGGGSEI